MPRLLGLTPKKVIKILLHEGFIIDHITGSHYVLFNKENGKRITVAYHAKDLPKGTLYSIIKSSGVDVEKFK